MSQFPPAILAAAKGSQARCGVPASITAAQWALESGWGKHCPGNNPFGIKAAGGQSFQVLMTWEVINGQHVRLPQHFAKFDTLNDAFLQHGNLVAAHWPATVHADADHAARALVSGRLKYATDPHYALELLSIINAHDLRTLDKAS